jgi:hypothetical protein
MAAVNTRRVALGAIVGGVVWTIWSIVVNTVILGSHYATAQGAGQLLKEARYPLFLVYWIITIFLLAYVLAWLYASVRATRGATPGTALTIGLLVGFAAGFPINLSLAAWAPFSRVIALGWMLDLWVGAILAALVAGWLYKD